MHSIPILNKVKVKPKFKKKLLNPRNNQLRCHHLNMQKVFKVTHSLKVPKTLGNINNNFGTSLICRNHSHSNKYLVKITVTGRNDKSGFH